MEDDTEFARSVDGLLTSQGYAILAASTATEAIDLALSEAGALSLVLIDLELGNRADGIRTARAILEKVDLPVIFLSSSPESELLEKTESIRAYGFICAKEGLALLPAAVRTALQIHESKRRQDAVMNARLRLMQFSRSHSLPELLQATLDEAEFLTESKIGFFHFLEADQVTLSLQAWSTNTTLNMCKAEGAGSHYPVNSAGVWVDCIHARRPVVHNHYASLTHRKGLPPGHAEICRELVVPVIRGDSIVAVLGVGNKPSEYGESDVEVVSTLADLAWDIAGDKRKEEALRESEERFRALVQNQGEGVAITDPEERITFANPAAEKIFGVSPGGLLGRCLQEFMTAEEFTRIRQQSARSKAGDTRTYDTEITGDDGKTRCLIVTASSFFDPRGQLDHSLGIFRDITARKQSEMEKERLEAQNRLLQKSESLNRMAGAIAHHFNNKLQAISLSLEMALEHIPADRLQPVKFLKDAMTAVQLASDVSSLMLTYLGQTHGEQKQLHLSEVVRICLPVLQASVPENIVVQSDFCEQSLPTMGNANQMQQILTNLLSNACEAIGSRQGTVLLSTRLESSLEIPPLHRFPINAVLTTGEYACLQVEDSGCGIPQHDIDKLFDPFFSTKFPGRGMGLSAVLGIVKEHNGVIVVESRIDHGSRFSIYLPLLPHAPLPCAPGEETNPEQESRSITMLLAEDEEAVRRVTTALLQHMGFRVLQARDGMEALDIFRKNSDRIQWVLCDISMPKMNGWETMTALRRISPDIPVILASGYQEEEFLERFSTQRPRLFLRKPFNRKELKKAIELALGEKN